MRLHDPAHHCKAQPGAASLRTAAGRVDTVETVENPIDVLWRDANAVILDGQSDTGILLDQTNPYMAILLAVRNGI